MTNRRAFITGALALLAAPAVIKASSLMPVRALFVPEAWLPADGRIILRSQYPVLCKLLHGSAYGTFARLPKIGIEEPQK